jgi:protein-tyrosine phosphatase
VGRVLVICTGNVCRSPYLERRLRQLLEGQDVLVESAGTRALVGADIEPGSVAALEAVGSDTLGFASRQLAPAMLGAADAPDPAAADPDTPWAVVVAEVARGRRGLHPARTAAESDIPDPYGRGSAAYDLMSTEIEAQLPVVVAALTPPAR